MDNYEKHFELPRRRFLKQAFGAAALAPFILNLEAVSALAQTNDDYKALVCVFMLGGNDATGTVIPRTQANYDYYAAKRGALAVAQNTILDLGVSNNTQIGVNPLLSELHALYTQGKAAALLNVGPLIVPTTKQQFENGSVPLPPNIFSHEDQILFWQTVTSGRPQQMTGWGGRMADLLNSLNNNPQVSMSISLSGDNYFHLAGQVAQFNCSPGNVGGLESYDPVNDPVYRRANNLWNRTPSNPVQRTYNQKMRRAVDQIEFLKGRLANPPQINTVFPANGSQLGPQMRRVAELIALRNELGQKRQIFFCGLGGFDTHEAQASNHPRLITDISKSIAALYNATVELGVADKVTIFTASDFGRTININGGAGTDHGWGGHHFIVGGAVNGGALYGRYPVVAANSPDDVGDGRWLPGVSVDQYGATLAKWFGVSQSNLPIVAPNLGNFNTADLGFMQ